MRLMTAAPTGSVPALADPGGEYPLYLMSLSTDKSQSSQWAKPPEGPALLTLHPDAARGVPDSGLARIESVIGSLVVRVKHDARQRPDVALMAKGGLQSKGQNANSLIRARTTDAGEGGALYDERVRVVAL
jgi:hypothetical protein